MADTSAVGGGDTIRQESAVGPLPTAEERRDGDAERLQLQFHALILSQVSDAVIAIDSDGRVSYVNASAEQQYQVTAARALGRPLSEIYGYRWIAPEDQERAEAALARDGFWRGENLHVLRNGR